MAYVGVIIGMRGQGKSTFIKKMIQGQHNYIFDVQNEYQEFNPAPHLDRKLFIAECQGYTDTYCIFEEATGFFKGRLDEQTDRMILSARHTRNRYIFCFTLLGPCLRVLWQWLILWSFLKRWTSRTR